MHVYVILATIILLGAPADAQTATHAELVSAAQANGAKDRSAAEAVVLAAESVATTDFPIELLLGLVDVESDFDSMATSRLVDGKRQTGSWRSSSAPPRATGNYFCGITQATAPTWKRCLELRNPQVAMTALAGELDEWLRRAGSPFKALQGHGCGNAGMTGACRSYAARVFRQARIFRAPKPTT